MTICAGRRGRSGLLRWLAAACLLTAGGAAWGQAFSPKVMVHSNPPGLHGPYGTTDASAMAVDSMGNVHVVWVGAKGRRGGIYYARSADGGTTFSKGLRLDAGGPPPRWEPAMAVDSADRIHIAWLDGSERTDNLLDIFYARSVDNGLSFEIRGKAWTEVAPDLLNQLTPLGPPLSVAADSQGRVHVAVFSHYARSADGGVTFETSTLKAAPLRAVALDARGNPHMAWVEVHPEIETNYREVRYASSTDGGKTFGQSVLMSTGTSVTGHPTLRLDRKGTIHLAWSAELSVFYAQSMDGGRSFSGEVRVGDSDYAWPPRPSLAVGLDGNVHIAWELKSRVAYAKSTDGGRVFTAPMIVGVYGTNPSVDVGLAGRVYVAWAFGGHVLCAKSDDAGASFGAGVVVDDPGPGAASWQGNPSMALDFMGNVHVAWGDDRNGNGDIYHAGSVDGGKTFGAEARVDDTGSAPSEQGAPAVAADSGGGIHVVWSDGRDGPGVYYAGSADGGLSFGSNVQVAGAGSQPAVAVDAAGNIHVAWRNDLASGIYYSGSANHGLSFGAGVRVAATPRGCSYGSQSFPSIAVDPRGNIHVAWEQTCRHEFESDREIYHAGSVDGGKTFGAAVRIDDTGAAALSQFKPAIAADSVGGVHVAWSDFRSRKMETYYAKSLDGGGSFLRNVRVFTGGQADFPPSIAVDGGGNIHVSQGLGGLGVHYSSSTDGGASFWPGAQVDGAGAGANWQSRPSMRVGLNGAVHVAWEELPKGGWDKNIYYSRTATEDATPPGVALLAPQAGAEVSGVVEISVKVQD